MYDIRNDNTPIRIVFYGRVSTEHEMQMSALENQMQWYDDTLKNHKNWNLINKYIDKGITGTQAKKRPAFLQMIEDAKSGEFDLIVTREVCRFGRNTAETLTYVTELKRYGVGVYFVSDGICSFDNDSELRLGIFSTLAQDESRRISERVKAGQYISRKNGVVYGSGNILGYERDENTKSYVINKEQAETVRMIFDMYLEGKLGVSKIANELIRKGRKNANHNIKWTTSSVSRILNNRTYTGYMEYGKSHSDGYLTQKRINSNKQSERQIVKSDFEALITVEEFEKCQKIMASRMIPSIKINKDDAGKEKLHCTKPNNDIWGSRLKCSCGASFKKLIWHKNQIKGPSYGYQCYNQLNNGSGKKMRKLGADDTGHCDIKMIVGWKLELMAKKVLENIWYNKNNAIDTACKLIEKCYHKEDNKISQSAIIQENIERVNSEFDKLIDLYTESLISKEKFVERKSILDKQIKFLNEDLAKIKSENLDILNEGISLDKLRKTLESIVDLSKPELDRDLIKKFISKIVVEEDNHFSWYVDLDESGTSKILAEVEGRKNKAVITLTSKEEQSSLLNAFNFYICDNENIKNAYLFSMQHKLLSTINNCYLFKFNI